MVNNDTVPVLDIQNLSVKFRMYDKGLRQSELQVISDISLNIKAGEIVAVAGSSGSGKSLLAHAVLGILPKNAIVSGSMKYCGTELTPATQAGLRGRDIALVPQSVSYLDPLKKVGPQVQVCMAQKNSSLGYLNDLNCLKKRRKNTRFNFQAVWRGGYLFPLWLSVMQS